MIGDKRSVDYLLGALPEREREAFERDYFSNPEAFDQVACAESELLDAYARDRLPLADRERVERVYLTDPRRRERLHFARTLAAAADADAPRLSGDNPSVRRWPRWQIAVAAAAVALFTGVIAALSIQSARLRRELIDQTAARATTEQALEHQLAAERARSAELQRELERARAAGTGSNADTSATRRSAVVALTLFGSGRRAVDDAAIPTLVVPDGAPQIRLELVVVVDASDYRSYQLHLQHADGREVLAAGNATPRVEGTRANFALVVPASRLPDGDYMLTLRGMLSSGEADDISRSRLRIARR